MYCPAAIIISKLANLCNLDQRDVGAENGEKEEYDTVIDQKVVNIGNGEKEEYNTESEEKYITMSEEKYNTISEEKYNTVSGEKCNTMSEENNASLQEVAKKPVSKSRENRIDGSSKKQMKYHRELAKTNHTNTGKIVVPIKDENGFQ